MCCKCSLSCRSNKLQAAMLACNLLSLWNIVAILMNYSDWKEKNYSEWKTKTAYKRCQWDATHLFLKLCFETSTLAFRSLTSLLLSLLLFGLIGYQLMQPNLGKKFFFLKIWPSDQSGTLSVGFVEGNVYSSTPDKGEVPACCHVKSVTNRMLHQKPPCNCFYWI